MLASRSTSALARASARAPPEHAAYGARSCRWSAVPTFHRSGAGGPHTDSVTTTAKEFVATLRTDAPEVAQVVREHFDDNEGELLIHLLMADLLRFCVAAFAKGDVPACRRCLDVVASALTSGDEHLRNAVEVSFVEHVGVNPGETPAFLSTWPKPLLMELREQGER